MYKHRMQHAAKTKREDDIFTLRPMELESDASVRPMSEAASQPPPLLQPDPSDTQQPTHRQAEIQMSEPSVTSTVEHQRQAKPAWLGHRRLVLLVLGVSLCAAALGLMYYVHQSLQNRTASHVTPCLSQACQRGSARLSAAVDPFTQPCHYFSFTCGSDTLSPDSGGRRRGGSIPGHPQDLDGGAEVPGRAGGRGRGSLLSRKTVLLQYLREMLESNDSLSSSAAQKARVFYASCLDTTSIETAGVEPFLTLVQKVGGWAVSGPWNPADFNSTLILLMRDYNTFPFFNLYVDKDPRETETAGTTKRYIQIDQPNLLIPIEWNGRTNKSQVKAQTLRPFLALCQTYLSFLGATSGSSMIHAGTFMSLSSELAVTAAPLRYRLSRGRRYQRMTIAELQSRAPAVDWLRCLRAVFHPLPIITDDHVLLHNLPYIVHMSPIIGKWLNKHELSSSGPLQTYMVLNLLHTLIPALDARFAETAKRLSVALENTKVAAPRWKHCVLETGRAFDSVLTHLVSQRVEHREAEEVILNIFSSFVSKLHELKGTNQTFQSHIKKIESLVPRLRTTNELPSEAELDLLFSKVSLNSSFFSNYVQLLPLWQRRRSEATMEQTEADILSVAPFVLEDELLFPVGMFVPPFFHPTYPRAMNYGAIGFLIAKDILHLLVPHIYSQSELVRAEGECVWANFLGVTEKENRTGASSLSRAQHQEVWVQYSALQIALQAYQQSLQNHPGDTSIAGLSYTRLFFSSFSQISCDSDPYHEFMPLEPSFLITVVCSKFNLCPSALQCPSKAQQHLLQKC